MLTVHHLGMSQSDRIVWLCEELGVDYVLKRYDRDPVTRMAPADYKALSPAGTAPVITDGDVVLGETNAIVDYIVAKHGGGGLTVGPDQPNFADYLFWLHFSNGSFMPALMLDMLRKAGGDSDMGRALGQRVDRAFALVEARLGKAAYFAGDAFTIADIVMLFPLTTMRMFLDRDMSGFPNIRAYLKRVTDREAFRRALDKADPGMPIKID